VESSSCQGVRKGNDCLLMPSRLHLNEIDAKILNLHGVGIDLLSQFLFGSKSRIYSNMIFRRF
jgi:hypothetical protein